FTIFFFYCSALTRPLHSFPTRRSSDLSCTVSRSKPPCSVSTKAQWKPAAARMRGTSGERSWPNPVPSCTLPSARACFTVFFRIRSEEHTSELQSLAYLVCRLLLEKKKK